MSHTNALLRLIIFYLALIILPAIAISSTSKRSWLRFLCIPWMIFFGYKLITTAPFFSNGSLYNGIVGSQPFVTFIHATNLLLINSLDVTDLVHEKKIPQSAGMLARITAAFSLLNNVRGIGTSWKAKNVPSFPAFFAKGSPPGRRLFLLRQASILVWQYHFAQTMALEEDAEDTLRLYGPGREFVYLDATAEQQAARVALCLLALLVGRTTIDFAYRFISFVFVGLKVSLPEDWPPMFGTMRDGYTLRKSWGKFWHQFLRCPFTSVTNLVTRDILRLPHPSILERYINLIMIFTLSGLLHVTSYIAWGLSPREPGPMVFFPAIGLGIVIEDGIQAAWRRLSGASAANGPWKRIVGFIWVLLWTCATAPWILYPIQRLPPERRYIFPFSIAAIVGKPIVFTAVAIGAPIMLFVFGAEI